MKLFQPLLLSLLLVLSLIGIQTGLNRPEVGPGGLSLMLHIFVFMGVLISQASLAFVATFSAAFKPTQEYIELIDQNRLIRINFLHIIFALPALIGAFGNFVMANPIFLWTVMLVLPITATYTTYLTGKILAKHNSIQSNKYKRWPLVGAFGNVTSQLTLFGCFLLLLFSVWFVYIALTNLG